LTKVVDEEGVAGGVADGVGSANPAGPTFVPPPPPPYVVKNKRVQFGKTSVRIIAASGESNNDYHLLSVKATSEERCGIKPVLILDPVDHARNNGKWQSRKDMMDHYHNEMYGELIDNGEDPDDDDERIRQDDFPETGAVAPDTSRTGLLINQGLDLIVDTGASNHMVSRKAFPPGATNAARVIDNPIVTNTANGQVTVNKRIDVTIPNLEVTVDPLIFEDTPPALAVGRLCEDGPFSFYWKNKSGKPSFIMRRRGLPTFSQ
jgi:hypothetical protein